MDLVLYTKIKTMSKTVLSEDDEIPFPTVQQKPTKQKERPETY